MKKSLCAASVTAAIVLVFTHASASCATDSPVSTLTTVTQFGTSTADFACKNSISDACQFLIVNSLCEDKVLANGTKERTCRYTEAVPPFSIKSGEKRTVPNLPGDFIYTMKIGTAPTMEECIRAPYPH